MQSSVDHLRRLPIAGTAASLYALLAAVYVFASLYTLYAASWTTIAFDQWRIYNDYFLQGFPYNVLASQNGHHPILPGLVFLADIYWFGAHNYLLSTVGVILAVATASMWSWLTMKDQNLGRPNRWMCTALVWFLLFWLANRRILGHGNESVHAFPVLCGLFLAVWALLRIRRNESRNVPQAETLLSLLSVLGCVIATFSFGLGVVTWPIVIGLALILRSPRRTIIALGGGALFSIVLLVLVAASSQDPSSREFQYYPLELLLDAAVWLGSPIFHSLAPLGVFSQEFLYGIAAPILGGVGMLIGLATLGIVVRRGRHNSDLEIWTLAVLGLGIGGALLIALARGSYFDSLPAQRVAPRYLLWTCAYWIAALTALATHGARLNRGRRAALRAWAILVLLLPLALIPNHSGRALEFTKYRLEEAGLGLALGIEHEEVIRVLFRYPAVVLDVADQLKARGLGMFSGPTADEVGVPLSDLYRVHTKGAFHISQLGTRRLSDDAQFALYFRGRIDGSASAFSHIAVVNDAGYVIGWGSIRRAGHKLARRAGLLLGMPSRFGGYITRRIETDSLTLYAVSLTRRIATPVATLPASHFGPFNTSHLRPHRATYTDELS